MIINPCTVVRALTSKNIFFFFFFVFYVHLKLSDDFLKNNFFFGPNGENWSIENFDIFSAKIDFSGF
jgi:hypothetical protein